MSRVKSVTSPWLMMLFLMVSMLATAAVVPFWETVTMSGTLFWSVNLDPVSGICGSALFDFVAFA